MNTIKIEGSAAYPDAEWNFIYNRLDLRFEASAECFHIFSENETSEFFVPFFIEKDCITLGVWLNPIPTDIFYELCRFIFSNYCTIQEIRYKNRLPIPEEKLQKQFNDECSVGNHWKVILPDTMEELLCRMSSKTRYTLRRKKRIAEEALGALSVQHFSTDHITKNILDIVILYFEFKFATHGTDYHMSPEEYLHKYYVTDIYTLSFGETIGAILFSCEQTNVVYLENLTYDSSLASYSLGALLYNDFLSILIGKGKSELILGAGHQRYKAMYGGIEQTVCSGTVYRNRWLYALHKIASFYHRVNRHLQRKVTSLLEKLCDE